MMKFIQISQFKATCLKLIKEVQSSGESLCLTLRGKPMVMVSPFMSEDADETVAETLARLQPLLQVDEELELEERGSREVPQL